MSKRLVEIDALRGLAVFLMAVYHFAFDGWFMGLWDLDLNNWPMYTLGMFVRFVFLGLVGVSIVLSSRDFGAQVKRGAYIFALGMILTIGTAIITPGYTIWFGILHMIGVSIPIVSLFKGRPRLALFTALFIWLSKFFIQGKTINSSALLWLGIKYPGFASLDYFPLIPWLTVPLVGIAVGHYLYGKRQATKLKVLAKIPGLTWLGRHALLVYMIHQPAILSFLYLWTKIF